MLYKVYLIRHFTLHFFTVRVKTPVRCYWITYHDVLVILRTCFPPLSEKQSVAEQRTQMCWATRYY